MPLNNCQKYKLSPFYLLSQEVQELIFPFTYYKKYFVQKSCMFKEKKKYSNELSGFPLNQALEIIDASYGLLKSRQIMHIYILITNINLSKKLFLRLKSKQSSSSLRYYLIKFVKSPVFIAKRVF